MRKTHKKDCPACEDAGFSEPFVLEFDIKPADPGCTSGPPENGYPPEGGYAEPTNAETVNCIKGDTIEVCPQCKQSLPDLDEVYEEWALASCDDGDYDESRYDDGED